MRSWDARRIAQIAGARIVRAGGGEAGGPSGASVDTRTLARGELFVGLAGANVHGGEHAGDALAVGAWGVLVAEEHAEAAAAGAERGAVLAHPDPLAALHALAGAWRERLRAGGASVIAVTGSTGKTSTKDILAALLGASMRTAASPANLNTEIGLPLALLGAPEDADAVVLEMAMRGAGQIAELTAIATPDVGVVVNVGPAHLELLGSLEAIAAAKAELIAGMRAGATVVVPAGEPLLAPHLREDLRTITFGQGGDVTLAGHAEGEVRILHAGEEIALRPSFAQAHQIENLLAAVAAARALGHTPRGSLQVGFSAMRGQRVELAGGVVLIDDCYNANPMSVRAALDDLAETAAGRRVAVLGDMLELGGEAGALHCELGRHARERGVDVLVTVGPLARDLARGFGGGAVHSVQDAQAAAELLGEIVREGDTVLVKGSRGVGLERVAAELSRREQAGVGPPGKR